MLAERKFSWFDPEKMHCECLWRSVQDALGNWPEATFDHAMDYGCGNRPYQALIGSVARRTTAVDVGENQLADVLVNAEDKLPVGDACMDVICSFQVLEHVQNPEHYLAEASRVCKVGGFLLLSVPSVWPYHPHPSDYRRWMLPGIVRDLERNGFCVVKHWPILNPVSSSIQYCMSVAGYLTRGRGLFARFACGLLALISNMIIALSEKLFTTLMRYGAGNYLVCAKRI